MLLGCGSLSSWVRRLVACVGGCFGCAQPTPIIAVDEPSKGLRIQGRSIKNKSAFDELWSSSPREMENGGAMQSRRSMSSMSTAAQSSDQNTAGSSSNPNEFVNQGLLLWNQTRQQWIGNRKDKPEEKFSRLRQICMDTSYGELLGNTKPFAKPYPLADMVEYLVCTWGEEGLYDD